MKITYRGHEIDVRREKCMAGYQLLYYSVFRVSDGYECTSGFQDSADSVRYMVKAFKERIDEELASPDPWEEKASMCRLLGDS